MARWDDPVIFGERLDGMIHQFNCHAVYHHIPHWCWSVYCCFFWGVCCLHRNYIGQSIMFTLVHSCPQLISFVEYQSSKLAQIHIYIYIYISICKSKSFPMKWSTNACFSIVSSLENFKPWLSKNYHQSLVILCYSIATPPPQPLHYKNSQASGEVYGRLARDPSRPRYVSWLGQFGSVEQPPKIDIEHDCIVLFCFITFVWFDLSALFFVGVAKTNVYVRKSEV